MPPLISERKIRRPANSSIKRDEILAVFRSVYNPWEAALSQPQVQKDENWKQAKWWLTSKYEDYLRYIFVALARERGADEIKIGTWHRQVTDANRKKTYDSENKFKRTLRDEGRLTDGWLTVEDARRYVKNILASDLWKKARRNAPRPVSVRPDQIIVETMKTQRHIKVGYEKRLVTGVSHRNKGKITMHPYHVNKLVVLHELAHQAGYGNHGRGFRLIQILLMAKFSGPKVDARGGVMLARRLHKLYLRNGLPVMLSDIPKPLTWTEWVDKHTKIWLSVLQKEWGEDHLAKAKRNLESGRQKLDLAKDEKDKLKKNLRTEVMGGTADGRELEVNLGLA